MYNKDVTRRLQKMFLWIYIYLNMKCFFYNMHGQAVKSARLYTVGKHKKTIIIATDALFFDT